MNILGCKWVYKLKFKADGSIERHKACLVAKGFHQEESFDYVETFSQMVKITTICILLSIAVSHKWHIHQLNISNGFLHGDFHETLLMKQPPGFIDPRYPNHVCQLKKSIYGLKQASQEWFLKLTSNR